MYFPIILPTICVGINSLGVRMLEGILRLSFIMLVATTIAFIFPALVLFFIQVLITVCVLLGAMYIISLFYKGDKDER